MSLVEKTLKKMRGAPGADVAPVRGDPQTLGVVRRPPVEPSRIISVDLEALRAIGMLPPKSEERRFQHEYRPIKRPLIATALGRGGQRRAKGNLIMLTSSVPGEGKTFTSLNLALSATSEKDLNVLLVDADVAKQHVSRLLGVQDDPGLLDALRDSAVDIESLILPTDVPGLSVLPAGTRSEHATELFASERMEQIARSLSEHDPHRIAIFDSPPLLPTTESQALAQVTGQIVVVVRAGVTPQGVLKEALSQIGDRPCLSVMLNQSVLGPAMSYYGYGESRDGASA